MKILITGFPGTGKSTISRELKRRGHTAFDQQNMHSYMHIQNRQTGKNIHPPLVIPVSWYDEVASYNWDTMKLSRLLQQNEDIFICSKAHNQAEFYKLFNKIFVLTLDSTDLMHRLSLRGENSLGKSPSEISDILTLRTHFEESLLNLGAIKINASKPISHIVDEILSSALNA